MNVEQVIKTVGGDVVKVVTYLPLELIKLEHIIADSIAAEPALKAGIIALIADIEDAEGSVVPLLGTGVLNIQADLAAFAKLQKLFADFKAFLPIAEADYKTLKADVAASAGSTPTS